MSEYQIGKDVGELFERVKALEEAAEASKSCKCHETRKIRLLTDEEKKNSVPREAPPQPWCTYIALGACPALNINFGDDLCVRPCPPCPDIIAVIIVDAKGKEICTLRVKWSNAGHCTECPPGGHLFVWV
jgi:hypothetical protein